VTQKVPEQKRGKKKCLSDSRPGCESGYVIPSSFTPVSFSKKGNKKCETKGNIRIKKHYKRNVKKFGD